jgi:DNA adenine methylase
MNSPIRWAGSKRQMLALLRSFWARGNRYIEPFAGSACLFFDIEPSEAVLGDLNADLINAYRCLRDDCDATLAALSKLIPNKENYYAVRSIDPLSLGSVDAAARFLFLNRLCFNGLYRTNMLGQFNVPIGSDPERIYDEPLLRAAAVLLKRTTLTAGDFEGTLDRARSGDFVFLDPPYILSARRTFAEYLPDSFREIDLDRLSKALAALDRRGVDFVITYADCREARELMSPWMSKRWRARRHISGFASHRRFNYELIATNRSGMNVN